MSKMISTTELQKMPLSELQKELKEAKNEATRLRLNLELQKEKNHAQFKGLKKQIARMTMVLDELSKKGLKEAKNSTTLPAASAEKEQPAKSAAKKPSKKASSISTDSK